MNEKKPGGQRRRIERWRPSARRRDGERRCDEEPGEQHDELREVHPRRAEEPARHEVAHDHHAAERRAGRPRHAGDDVQNRRDADQLRGEDDERADPQQGGRQRARAAAVVRLDEIADGQVLAALRLAPDARANPPRQQQRADARPIRSTTTRSAPAGSRGWQRPRSIPRRCSPPASSRTAGRAGRARPATKKSRAPRTSLPIHAPSATSPTEYASRRTRCVFMRSRSVARAGAQRPRSLSGRNARHRRGGAHRPQDGLRRDVRGQRADEQQVVRFCPRRCGERKHGVAVRRRVHRRRSRGQTRRAPSAPASPPAAWSACALVATTASVVFSAGAWRRREGTSRSSRLASASARPSSVRTPATTAPVAGSMTSP